MKPLVRYLFLLAFLILLLICLGYFINLLNIPGYFFSDAIILTLSISIINGIILVIYFRGQIRDPESQTLHTMVSISLKFLLELLLALVWFIVIKKTAFPSVLIFFVLYLTLTLFSVLVILKTLKNKSL